MPAPQGVFAHAPVSLALVIVNLVIYLGEVLVSHSVEALFPAVPSQVLMAFGGNYAMASLYEGRIETLLTSCFIHGSLLHVAFNVLALRQVGPLLERYVGSGRFTGVYFVSGIVGSMVSTLYGWAVTGERLGVGASGAICGLIGAALVVGYRAQGKESPLANVMGRWLIFTALFGLLPGVDNAAHLGGAIAGAIVAFVWHRGPESPQLRVVTILTAVAVSISASALVLVHDARDPFATLRVDERLAVAEAALRSGRCKDARAALQAAARVAPRSPQVGDAANTIAKYCGR